MFLAKFVAFVVSPLGTALVLAFAALCLRLTGSARVARVLLALGLVWLTIWSLPTPSLWLRGRIEAQYPVEPIKYLPNAEAIVVLGGGIEPPSRKGAPPDMQAGADRVWHAARLYKAGKAPLLLLSGGSDKNISVTSEAAAMRELLVELGVPPRAMILEENSRNTEQNAAFSTEILRSRKIQKVLLVTSALHMDRAMAQFNRMGIKAIPAPSDHEMRPVAFWRMWIPGTEWLDGSSRAIKEIVGRWAIGS